jgi:hypothetical protein
MLTVKERNDAAAKIIDFNDDDTLGLLFLPPAVQGRPINILPSPAENRGLVPRLPDQGNTPGDTLFLLTGGAEFNPYAINLNLFCSSYSLATSTGEENSQGGATCIDLTGSPTPGTPNEFLRNFWRAWQAARS